MVPVQMARLVALLALVAGCRSSERGGSRTVAVDAFAGEQPEPAVTVIGHAADGTVIDQTTADAVGYAEVGVDDGALVSVVFPGSLGALTPVISVITVPVPADDTPITVHGPGKGPAPLIVGVLEVDGPNLPGAAYFDIRIGCATVRVAALPATFDVGACSMGSDTQLDVLVAGYHDVGGDPPAPQLDGYAAGRVEMVNGVATFAIADWQAAGTDVPVTLDGIAPAVELELLSDGLSFGSQPLTDHGTLYTGLAVDAARVTASLAGIDAARVTTREVSGAPSAIALSADDFLSAIDVTTSLAGTTLAWEPAGLGDAVDVHASWQLGNDARGPAVPTGPHRVIWDAVLPPDAASVTLPALDGDLAAAIMPVTIEPPDILVRYVDSSELDGFTALVEAGIHAEEITQPSTIAPRPTDGELRTSYAIGVR